MKKTILSMFVLAILVSCTKQVDSSYPKKSEYVSIDSVVAHSYNGKIVYELFQTFTGKHIDSMHFFVADINDVGVKGMSVFTLKNPSGKNGLIFTNFSSSPEWYNCAVYAGGELKEYMLREFRLIIKN